MKKELKMILLTLIAVFVIVLVGYMSLQLLIVGGSERFDYSSAKKEATKYLKENKKELQKIANKLYQNKSSKKKPYKYIRYSSYCDYTKYDSSLEKSEYIQFDMDAQGFLGGQYYGLIYSKNKNIYEGENLFVYDEYQETGDGNNKFIREKISNDWYFYYNDFDGKVNINDIQ